MISIKQLSYAIAVEKTLHFKKAADLCFVSQSALSAALSELEKQLGLQIFERNNKQVLVTPIGREVLKRAKNILLSIEDLEHLAGSQSAPLSFPMSIGVIPTIAPYLLPRIFPFLNQHFPLAQINVVEEQSQQLVAMVRSGEIDTAILALPYPCEGLLSLEFWQEDFYWVTLKGTMHSQQSEITSDQVTQTRLMLLKEGHCLKDHALDVCQLTAQRANHGFGATSLNTLIQMVQGNLGTTFIPAMAKEQLIAANDQLSVIHLNEPGPHRRIAFVFRPNYTCMSSIEALVDICKSSLLSG
ncbi:hydrogen peroxide-inducible genes activator [Photobacterium lutimaris]|uniref:LysR family transcriptional regulator n=1 Tax=Photobacterium lutimaris TaxID=388278 RepID=A0A2T3J1G3_9GAMM|nr:hydrogen peroxide-inducible genes activator [Photobacterium lutimaris]PSU34897.1 LysR family transcriptional regulator [Photobacterium lutimaris]TDR77243.1 LysR family transcriptional regulator [Photobacterium lutimaris]